MKSDKNKIDSKDENQKTDKENDSLPEWNLDLPEWNLETTDWDIKLTDWNPDLSSLDKIVEEMSDWNPDLSSLDKFTEQLSEFQPEWIVTDSEQSNFVFEDDIPEHDPNLTAKDVADWMLSQVANNGNLYQDRVASHISRYFGKKFVYQNKNGNIAIEKPVLEEFLKISHKNVVWVRPKRFWRMRQPSDPINKREVKY